ncbi:MAG: Hsp20/alpha crystallin family protein [Patescibacteria group bacterium]
MPKNKLSFFERLTGSIHIADDFDDAPAKPLRSARPAPMPEGEQEYEAVKERDDTPAPAWAADNEEGELPIDMYQTPHEVIVKAMIAGVRPEDLEISISREMVTIRGRRQEHHEVSGDDFFHQELYWGTFSRTILLPHEVEAEEAEAIEKHGLLTIRLPKINKEKVSNLKVKSL